MTPPPPFFVFLFFAVCGSAFLLAEGNINAPSFPPLPPVVCVTRRRSALIAYRSSTTLTVPRNTHTHTKKSTLPNSTGWGGEGDSSWMRSVSKRAPMAVWGGEVERSTLWISWAGFFRGVGDIFSHPGPSFRGLLTIWITRSVCSFSWQPSRVRRPDHSPLSRRESVSQTACWLLKVLTDVSNLWFLCSLKQLVLILVLETFCAHFF